MKKYNIIEAIKLPIGTEFIVNGNEEENEGIVVIRESRDIVEGAPWSEKILVWKPNNKPLIIGEYEAEAIFTKVQKSLTFFEAMAKADDGEKVTNDYLKDKDGDYIGCYLKKGNKLHYYALSNNAGGVFGISEDEMISNWYIYEE